MDLPELRYFLAVTEHETLRRAAASLHLSEPALSQAIKRLEQRLGAELFHRVGRGLVLTAAGEAVIGPARRALREVENVLHVAHGVTSVQSGRLRIVCLPRAAGPSLATAIGAFRQQYPGIDITISTTEERPELERLVADGQFDFGVTDLPLADRQLQAEHLEFQEWFALLPPDYSGPAGSMTLADLADQPLITLPPGTSMRRLLDQAFADAGITPHIAVETSISEVMTLLVFAGAGVAVVPLLHPRIGQLTGMQRRGLAPPLVREVGLAYLPAALSPAAAAFLERIRGVEDASGSSG